MMVILKGFFFGRKMEYMGRGSYWESGKFWAYVNIFWGSAFGCWEFEFKYQFHGNYWANSMILFDWFEMERGATFFNEDSIFHETKGLYGAMPLKFSFHQKKNEIWI